MKTNNIVILLLAAIVSVTACSNEHSYESNDPDAAPDAPACYDVNDLYQSYQLFFKPEKGWVGDPMPLFEGGKFHIFYLQDARDGQPTFHPWYEVTTSDFVNYEDNGEMIPCGTEEEQDGALGTGSVFKHNGRYYAFYTGHNGALDPREKILLATSSDLKNWTKEPSFALEAGWGYDRNEFRDPIVIRDEQSGTFKLLISTRADYKGSWRAVIAQYSSTDLMNWSLEEPFYDDDRTFMVECPDIFTEGNYQYLIYSDIDDRKVHYRYRQTGNSEWIEPSQSAFDGVGYYAGKTASDGTNRYLFGWCPTRAGNNDYTDYSWGGALVVHQLVQNSDGTLRVTLPTSLNSALNEEQALRIAGKQGATANANSFTLNATHEQAYTVFDREKGAFKIKATIQAGTSDSFGFEFGAGGNRREVFAVTFLPNEQQVQLNQRIYGAVNSTLAATHLPVPADKRFEVTIVVENSVCVVYVNNEIALSCRIYKMNQNPWAIFADSGEVSFSSLQLFH